MTSLPTIGDSIYVCTDYDEEPVCDFCQWYRFNGDLRGAYVGAGECVHPAHPHPEEPHGGCDDYVCADWPTADPRQKSEHAAASRRG
jgi:hypothetical protein